MNPEVLEAAAEKLLALAKEARAKKGKPMFNYQGLVDIIIALLTQAKPFLPSS